MTIAFSVKDSLRELGAADFVHAFFSTISFHLEPDGWGTKYPRLMNELYQGELSSAHAAEARRELEDIKRKLTQKGPDAVVWDIENLDAKPPWGENISPVITDLANYFVTSDGRKLIEVLDEGLSNLAREDGVATLQPF
jgi:hypothetical protein